jgi:formate dehydrogenase major subunit
VSERRVRPAAVPPAVDDEAGMRVAGAQRTAAGVPAVLHALADVRAQLGTAKTLTKGARTLLRLNQPDGFDCPGCAWPDPAHTSPFEFCENGAKAIAEEATERRLTAEFFAAHTLPELDRASDYWLGQQGRLTEPMVRHAGREHYEPIGWDTAFDLIAARLNALASPDRAVFYTSGRTSNEAAFLYQLLARTSGTNNLPDCSNMCHESSGVALSESIGIGKGTVSLDDIHHARLILVIGQNPGTNHPRMLAALERAKRNGARIVSINPLREAGLVEFRNPQRIGGVLGRGTKLADLHLPIRVAADLALFQLVNRRLVADGAVDREFVDSRCAGFPEYAAHLDALDTEALLAATALDAADVAQLTEWIAGTDRIVACWAMGLTQHRQAVATIQEIANTLLLRGAFGKPGAGACPVRGHSNVQGDRTMGIYERPAEPFLAALDAEFGVTTPRHHGYDTVGAIAAMTAGAVDVFVGMGGNFVAAAPDTAVTAAAMRRVGLTVQVSTKLNRSHVAAGETALILPCLGRTEADVDAFGRARFVTVEDSMSAVHASVGRNAPASGELRSEPEIVAAIGARLTAAAARAVPWGQLGNDYDAIRDRIAAVIPGFADFNGRVRAGGFVLPNLPRDAGEFALASGRAQLAVNTFTPVEVPPGRLLLQTLRSHDQFNTTVYGLDDRYRGITHGRRVVFVAPADLAALGFADGEIVDVVSEWRDGTDRRATEFRLVAYDVPAGTCAAYFPEANVLVPLGSTALGSNTPTSKAVVVRLEHR